MSLRVKCEVLIHACKALHSLGPHGLSGSLGSRSSYFVLVELTSSVT